MRLITGLLLKLLCLLLEWWAAVMCRQMWGPGSGWGKPCWKVSTACRGLLPLPRRKQAAFVNLNKLIINKCPFTLLVGLGWMFKGMSLHFIRWRRTGARPGAPWLDWKFTINLEHGKNIDQKSHFLVKALNNFGQKVSEQPMFLKELRCLGLMSGLDI